MSVLDFNHAPPCERCGQLATHAAQDIVRHHNGTVSYAGTSVRYGCDAHPVHAVERQSPDHSSTGGARYVYAEFRPNLDTPNA